MPEQYFLTWSSQLDAPHMVVTGAEHDEFILEGGRRVYDFTSTSFQTSFGHCCEPIRQRIHRQLDEMPIASPKALFELKARVSDRLVKLLGLDGGRIFYTVSGSESVENALKIARHCSGRDMVMSRRQSYHGASLGSMSVSGDWRSEAHLNFSAGTLRIPEPDDDPQATQVGNIIQETGADNIAAVIVETISGVNGVVIPPQSWWDGLVQHCREQSIHLICDEVLAGFGRTGKSFAFQHFGLKPDLVCMSKGITGGYIPFGAVWVTDTIANRYDEDVLACGLTNYGHPLGLAALDAVLDLLTDEEFLEHMRVLEKRFGELINQLAESDRICGYRQSGLLAAIDFVDTAPAWQECLDAGLYLVRREQMLVLAPPFVSTPQRLEQAFHALQNLVD